MTIQAVSNYYVLTTPCGKQIKCHNRATAEYYLRLLKAGKEVNFS